MLKIAYGEESFLIKEKVQTWIPEGYSVERHYLSSSSLGEALMACNTLDLFSNGSKVVICEECDFLGPEKKLSDEEDKLLNAYMTNPSSSTILIFIKAGKLDKRKKIVKTLLKEADAYEAKQNKYPQTWLKKRASFYGRTLSEDAVSYITANLDPDLFLLDSELQKVFTYYNDGQTVTANMLIQDDILSRSLESDIFKLINEVVRKKPIAINILSDLIQVGNEPIKILLLIARQVQIIHQILLSQNSNTKLEISIHPYALQLAKEQAALYTLEEVERQVQDVAQLDLQMKRGEVDKAIALETLILKWL